MTSRHSIGGPAVVGWSVVLVAIVLAVVASGQRVDSGKRPLIGDGK